MCHRAIHYATTLGLLIAHLARPLQLAHAQPEHEAEVGLPFITNYRPSEYGAHNQNWAIAEDNRGVMYFGNVSGVLEYDGVSWRLIQLPNKGYVRSLAKDADGRIWVGGLDEFGYLAPDSLGQQGYVSLLEQVPEEDRLFGHVWTTFPTAEGVYFQTPTRIFRWSKGQMQIIHLDPECQFAFMIDDKVHIRQWEVGLVRIAGDSLHRISEWARLAKEPVYAVLPYDENHSLVVSRTKGLWLDDGIALTRFETEADDLLLESSVYRAVVLPGEGFALGTSRSGVLVIDREGRLLRVINQAGGLQNHTVFNLHVDRSGSLWMALESGIARVDLASPLTWFNVDAGLTGVVNAIARHQGMLYVATIKGVSWLDPATRSFRLVEDSMIEVYNLLSMDGILVATGVRGLQGIEGDRAFMIRSSVEGDFTSFRLIRTRRGDRSIFASHSQGLSAVRLDASGTFLAETRISVQATPGTQGETLSMVEEEDGSVWLGTATQGVLRVTYPLAPGIPLLGQARVEQFGAVYGLPEGGVHVSSVNNQTYFSTQGGQFLFDAARRVFVPDSTFNALSIGGHVFDYTLEADHKGRAWVNFGLEVGVAMPRSEGGYTLEKTPFMPFADVAVHDIYPEDNGVVWFGSPEGLIRYDEGVEKNYAADFPALIRRVRAGDGRLLYGGTGDAKIAVPVLDYAENQLRFEFAAPFYEREDRMQYQVQLEGFDPAWLAWSPAVQKEYTNLPEGMYRFRVRARNVYGHESREAVYAFDLLPPWWRTIWAYAFYGLLVMAVVAQGFRWQHARIVRREREAARERELEQARQIEQAHHDLQASHEHLKATQAQLIQSEKMASLGQLTAGIAHEIKNPLNFVNNFAEVNAELADELEEALDADEDKTALKEIIADLRQNATVIAQHGKRADSIVYAMMQHASVGTGQREPTDINQLVSDHIDLAYHGKRAQAGDLQVEIERDLGEEVEGTEIVPQEIGRVLLNLLSNAFDAVYEQAQAVEGAYRPTVTVCTRQVEGQVEIRVKDNGPGIPTEIKKKIFEPFFTTKPTGQGSTGLGLSLAYDIVTQGHRGTLTEGSKEGEGATFVVTLPG